MKIKNYEKKELVLLFSIIIIFIESILVFVLFNVKENKYIKIKGLVIKDNLVVVVIDKRERKIIYSNKILYLEDSKKKYKIREDRGVLIKKDKSNYYELVLEVSFKNKKTNDVLELVIKEKKFRLIEIFKLIWEGG